MAHESMWMTNIAYLLGYDGITFNSTTRQFQPINRASSYLKKNRIHVNKILPTVQNRLARLCKNPPKYDVRPESNSTEDKEAARLGQQILGALWERLNLDEKRILLLMWVQQCGHAWMKVSWDPSFGKAMVDPMTGELSYEGDVKSEPVSPLEIFPDPMAKTQEDVLNSWLIQCKVRKLDYFKLQYPEKGHLVKSEDAWLLSVQYEQRINALNSRGPSQGGIQDQMKNSAIEMIKYEARSKDYPNGRMIICANGILLEDKELPVGEIPFRKFDDVLIAGKLYSESIITHLRPIQDNYNENRRRQSEWMKKFLAGKIITWKGNGLQQESLNDESGEVLQITPVPTAPGGGTPIPLTVPALPQWAFSMNDKDIEEINDISGISEVSRGTLPSAGIPAIGMQLLTEQDDTRIGVMTEQHEHSWAGVGSLILKYVEKYYLMPRKLKIAGKNLQYTVKEVSGQDLRGNTDVYVIRGSTLPGSKTLKRQEILNAYRQGLLGDPMDPKVREKVLNMIEFGDVAEVWADYGLDMAQIKRGMDQLEQGQPVEVSEFDNHALWLQELNRFRKGDKFETLPPETQQLMINTMESCLKNFMQVNNMLPQPDPMAQAQDIAGPPPVAAADKLSGELDNRAAELQPLPPEAQGDMPV